MAAFSKFDKTNQLHHLNDEQLSLVQDAKEHLGGPSLLEFVSLEYAIRAQEVYDALGSPILSGGTIWDTFQIMLPIMQGRGT